MMQEKRYIKNYKIITLISGGLLVILILSAWIREGFFRDWRRYQSEYKDLLSEEAKDSGQVDEYIRTRIGIRQIVLNDLDRVDRCVSCHLGIEDPRMDDVQQPHKLHPGDHLTNHALQEFGCTVCHAGQGRALDKKMAFGREEDVYWPFPLLDHPYIQSSCGKCHLTIFSGQKELTGTGIFLRGQQIFNREGCLGCHKARGVGGTVGPDLTEQGEKTKHEYNFQNVQGEQTISNWMKEHFKDPEMVSPGSQMLKMNLPDEDLVALVTFTMGLARPELPFEYLSLKTLNEFKGSREFLGGDQIYSFCCSACHGKEGEGKSYQAYKTGITAIGNRDFMSVASADFIHFTLQNGRSGRLMSSWQPEYSGILEEEIDSLVIFINRNRISNSSYEKVIQLTGNVGEGRQIYSSNCELCHGPEGQGGIGLAINNNDFLTCASDEFIFGTLHLGRKNAAMPSWSYLTSQEMADLIILIRSWQTVRGKPSPVDLPEGNAGKGELQFHYLCSRCHGEFGEGNTGPAILNKDFLSVANDQYLYRTIAEGRSHTAMFGWTTDVYGEERLKLQDISNLIAYMRYTQKHKWDYIYPGSNPGDAGAGERLFGNHCSACHGNNGEGIKAPALNNQEFLNTATNGFVLATVSMGREGTDMPSWGRGDVEHQKLSGKERQDIVAFIRSLQKIKIKQ